MMIESIDAPAPPRDEEQRVLLEGISWDRFERLSACFHDTKLVRLSYIDGRLEIMSPVGEAHERYKCYLSMLLEAYLDWSDIRFYKRGGFTLVKAGFGAGEPDESYCIGADKEVPDIVIEIVVTSGALSKLPLYLAKGVKEVWTWQDGDLRIDLLEEGANSQGGSSRLLPDLNVDLLVAHMRMPDQYDAVRAFRNRLAQQCHVAAD